MEVPAGTEVCVAPGALRRPPWAAELRFSLKGCGVLLVALLLLLVRKGLGFRVSRMSLQTHVCISLCSCMCRRVEREPIST